MDPQGRSGRCVAAYGSEGQGFESLQARQRKSPCCGAYGLLLLRGVPGVRRAIAQPSTLVSSPSANMLRPDLIRPDRLDARDPRDARRPSDGGQRRGTRTCVSRRAQPCGRRVAAWRMVRAVLRVVVFPFFLLHLNNVLCTPRKLSRLDWLPASATTCRTTRRARAPRPPRGASRWPTACDRGEFARPEPGRGPIAGSALGRMVQLHDAASRLTGYGDSSVAC